MDRGGKLRWWDPIDAATDFSQMDYECDADLGAPSVADCAQLEWQGLGIAGQTVDLAPSKTKYFIQSKFSRFANPRIAFTF